MDVTNTWFTGIIRTITVDPEPEFDIVIDIVEELEVSDWPFGQKSLSGTGPLRIVDGITGNGLLVETGHTNLIIDSSFEDGF